MRNKILVFIFFAGLVMVRPVYAADIRDKTADESPSAGTAPAGDVHDNGPREVEVFRSESRDAAERSAEGIRQRGYETAIWSEVTKEGKTLYRVFVVLHGGQSPDTLPSTSGAGRDAAEKPVSSEEEERPIGTSKALAEAVEKRARFIHAALSVTEVYDDNAFSSHDNTESGYATILTPEVWALLPHYYENPLPIENSSTHSPGGLLATRLKPEVNRRYYAYLYYKADIPVVSKNTVQGNGISYEAKGRIIYNFGRGLYLDVIDQFVRSYESRATDLSVLPGESAKYKSNLFNAIVYYDTSNRTRLRLDYANYYLALDDPSEDFRSRTDNVLSAYFFYRFRPKTSAFVQYSFTDVKYKASHSFDSREHLFAGGLKWDITARSVGIIKAGYGIKDFVSTDDKVDNLILEAQIRHRFSSKRQATLTAFRKTNETDIDASSYVLSHGVRIDCQQSFSAKLAGFLHLSYWHDKYHARQGTGDPFGGLENNTYEAGLIFQYKFKRWLESDFGYTYTRRASSVDDFSFANNALIFRITGVL
jgi:Putative beta-barrel porin 2